MTDFINALKRDRETGGAVTPKTIAAALPMLIQEAAAYYRSPDQDAGAISRQIREAFGNLEKRLCSFE